MSLLKFLIRSDLRALDFQIFGPWVLTSPVCCKVPRTCRSEYGLPKTPQLRSSARKVVTANCSGRGFLDSSAIVNQAAAAAA
ncbi:MAG: hypothetical protein ACRD1L_09260 [Terriglobales bacterium]